MKKHLFKIALISIFTFAIGYNVYSSQKETEIPDFILENIEALANNEANSNGNTGPSELYDCPFWFTGDGVHCKCENTNNCTAIPCD